MLAFDIVLLEQQALLTLLLGQMRQSRGEDQKRIAFEQLTMALAGHLTALDQAVFPALCALPEGPDDVRLAGECAAVVSRMLADLLVSGTSASTGAEQFALLSNAVLKLFELERELVLPGVHRLPLRDASDTLASELELHMSRALGDDGVRAFLPTVRGEL